MYQCEIVRPCDLSPSDRTAWLELLAQNGLTSPLVHPDFAVIAGRSRPDARIALFKDRRGLAAAFAYHRRPGGFARPIGAAFSDVHAAPARADFALPLNRMLHAAGLRTFRFSALQAPDPRVFGPAYGPHSTLSAVMNGDPDTFLEARRSEHPRKFKGLRRLARRLAEDHGPVSVQMSTDQGDRDRLFAWKRAQFAASRRHDVLSPGWATDMMEALFDDRDDAVRGLLITLSAGERVIAGEFGPRAGPVFHPWIAAYDPEFSRYSPGHLLVERLISAMPALGLSRYDMGPGEDAYKTYFANLAEPVYAGAERAPVLREKAMAGLNRTLQSGLTLCGPRATRFVRKIHGRLDHIAAAETDPIRRLQGLGRAAGALFDTSD